MQFLKPVFLFFSWHIECNKFCMCFLTVQYREEKIQERVRVIRDLEMKYDDLQVEKRQVSYRKKGQ